MDREEFEARVTRCRGQLMRIARRYLPPGECEDAVQSAMLLAWEHLPQLRRESALEAWLAQILVNQCRQALRQRKKDEQVIRELRQLHDETAPAETCLHDALGQMRPDARDLLLMRHEQGYTIGELAEKLHTSEDAVKMRLHRARQRLRILLVSLLLLLLLATAAVGTGVWDVDWFLRNRRASPAQTNDTDLESAREISYSGRFLTAEVSDVRWELSSLELLFTYSIAGTDDETLAVHSGCLGVDGMRFDHIWTGDAILPVETWAKGKAVRVYTLDGWRIGGMTLNGSEDFLPDGLGESFFAHLYLDRLTPELYAQLLNEDGLLKLECGVTVRDFGSSETLETGLLTLRVAAPTAEEWRSLHEAYNR